MHDEGGDQFRRTQSLKCPYIVFISHIPKKARYIYDRNVSVVSRYSKENGEWISSFFHYWSEMDLRNTSVMPLHYDWKYLDACCNLLNEEWPRSTTARWGDHSNWKKEVTLASWKELTHENYSFYRMHSLKSSCDHFPTSLILLSRVPDTDEEFVLGHSKISPMHNYPSACFVEAGESRKQNYFS